MVFGIRTMMNFYSYYKRSDLDNNEYSHSLDLLHGWRYNNANGAPQLSNIENILHFIKRNAPWANAVARDIIKDRWIEAEPYIMKDAYTAWWYANNVIKGRWVEAEPYIMKYAYSAFCYAKDIIKGRWVEAEPFILKDPHYASQYAQYVIKSRWMEAELVIKTSIYNWELYARHFGL